MRCQAWMALITAGLAFTGSLAAQQLERRAVPIGQGARGAEPAQGGRRIALVIGNGAYQNVARLPNPANDARLIAGTLQRAGFTLVGGGPQVDLDKAQFDKLIQQFGRQLPGADVALFYYSGHGMQVQGVNWLVPVDANPSSAKDMDFQMVDASLVLRQMEDAGTKLNMVILDACRNNPFAIRGVRAAAGGLGEMAAPEGTLISYATQPGNVALDGDSGDSPYTVALAKAIERPGSDVFHVFNEVGLVVKQGTAGAQQPWLATSPIAGNFYFFSGPVTVENPNITIKVEPTAPAHEPEHVSSRFDGLWNVDLVCPTEGVAGGYTFHFPAQISHGVIHGEYGTLGEPASLLIEGQIDEKGVALLKAAGRTGRREHNIESFKSADPGTPYKYPIMAKFEDSVGTGSRADGLRTCNYTFRR
jgi:caspase domain-containing protein